LFPLSERLQIDGSGEWAGGLGREEEMIDTKEAVEGSMLEPLEAAGVAAGGGTRRFPWTRWLVAGAIAAAVVGGGVGATVTLTRSETPRPALDRRADYGLRHPGANPLVSVGAPAESDLLGDYGLRHPGFPNTAIDRTGDYALRHPGT
jgi:hypothetical protein